MVLMLLTVGMWASAPLVVALLEVSGSPFLFAASMEAGALLAYLSFCSCSTGCFYPTGRSCGC